MVWLSNRRDPARAADPVARAKTRIDTVADTPDAQRSFAITPGFHPRSLATLSTAADVVVGSGAACARVRLDAPRFTAWDETVAYLTVAWLAFRLF
jgi:hypothetical protein